MFYYYYRLLPRKLLSRLFYWLARIKIVWIKNVLIRGFCFVTKANTDFAAEKDPFAYPTLNAFFTRTLAADARPIDAAPESIISPVDGRCAYHHTIENGLMIQAKSQRYSLAALLNSYELAQAYESGTAITLYLAPDDYHRVHMPCDGHLVSMTFCPGDKHSVALDLLEKIPLLFAGNERLVCHFETELGKMSVIFVGALNVSSISTVWHGIVSDNGADNHYFYPEKPFFAKGAELGQFNLGSTVILCFQSQQIDWQNEKLNNRDKILMGEKIACTYS